MTLHNYILSWTVTHDRVTIDVSRSRHFGFGIVTWTAKDQWQRLSRPGLIVTYCRWWYREQTPALQNNAAKAIKFSFDAKMLLTRIWKSECLCHNTNTRIHVSIIMKIMPLIQKDCKRNDAKECLRLMILVLRITHVFLNEKLRLQQWIVAAIPHIHVANNRCKASQKNCSQALQWNIPRLLFSYSARHLFFQLLFSEFAPSVLVWTVVLHLTSCFKFAVKSFF